MSGAWGHRLGDRSQPGTGAHWALWDAGTSSSCCRGQPDPGSAGSCGSPRPWEAMLTGVSPRVGFRHGCSLVRASTGIGGVPISPKRDPGVNKTPAAKGDDGDPSILFSWVCSSLEHPGRVAHVPPSGREHPGAGGPSTCGDAGAAWPGGTGAGRPQSCLALPQRPRKEVVAFRGEEKGSRAASAGQAQLPPLAPGSVRVDCPESMNEPRRPGTEPSPPCPRCPAR